MEKPKLMLISDESSTKMLLDGRLYGDGIYSVQLTHDAKNTPILKVEGEIFGIAGSSDIDRIESFKKEANEILNK